MKIMKAEYQVMFAAAVAAKVKMADSIGSKTTWTTQDHLNALAQLIADKVGCEAAPVLDILRECYNVSAFAQSLEKVPAFKAAGHFQRTGKGTPTLDSLIAMLDSAKVPATGSTQG